MNGQKVRVRAGFICPMIIVLMLTMWIVARPVSAQEATDCGEVSLASEMTYSADLLRDAPGSDQATLQRIFDNESALETRLANCLGAYNESERGNLLATIYKARQARVMLLELMHRNEDAYTLAQSSAVQIAQLLAQTSPEFNLLAVSDELRDIRGWMLAQRPQQIAPRQIATDTPITKCRSAYRTYLDVQVPSNMAAVIDVGGPVAVGLGTAECLAHRGYRTDAIDVLIAALHSGDPSESWFSTRAFDLLANIELQLGR